jgi:hypothetical protein
MTTCSDRDIKVPDIVCCGDIIEFTFIICNEEDTKTDSKGRVINLAKDANDVKGYVSHSINGKITNIEVDRGAIDQENESWTIPILKSGEQANAVVEFTVEDDCSEEFKVEMKFPCFKECLIKKIDPLTCCEVKRCVTKGELDCTKLTK